MGILSKLFSNLSKSREKISDVIKRISSATLDDSMIEELETVLIESDMGWELTDKIIDELKGAYSKDTDIQELIVRVINNHFQEASVESYPKEKVVLIVGVNGVGKTTSIAKIAHHFKGQGENVVLVAADTFRAGAVEQLNLWAKKLQIDIVKNESTNDPAAIAYDGVSSSKSRGYDRVLIDTSGRMHNSTNLKNELEKIYNVVKRQEPSVEVLVVIDANLGQNSISQIKEFSDIVPVDGAIVTKLDGTAKGGIILKIIEELKIPVYFLGTGESENDLVRFSFNEYLENYFRFNEVVDG